LEGAGGGRFLKTKYSIFFAAANIMLF